jgi:hypothetical protein
MKLITVLAASAALCVTAACATRQTSEASEARTLASPTITATPRESSATAEVRGETAATFGDDQTAVKLFERSVAERPTALNEFNLAAAYGRTGRPKEAIAMYRLAAANGMNQEVTGSGRIDGSKADATFNISQEAQKRIAQLEKTTPSGAKDSRSLTDAQAAKTDALQPH